MEGTRWRMITFTTVWGSSSMARMSLSSPGSRCPDTTIQSKCQMMGHASHHHHQLHYMHLPFSSFRHVFSHHLPPPLPSSSVPPFLTVPTHSEKGAPVSSRWITGLTLVFVSIMFMTSQCLKGPREAGDCLLTSRSFHSLPRHHDMD